MTLHLTPIKLAPLCEAELLLGNAIRDLQELRRRHNCPALSRALACVCEAQEEVAARVERESV